jgi:hypothetical protein
MENRKEIAWPAWSVQQYQKYVLCIHDVIEEHNPALLDKIQEEWEKRGAGFST